MLRLEFNKVLDKFLKTEQMTSEDYEKLDFMQEMVIQELKRAFMRIKRDNTIDPITGVDTSLIPF